MSWFIRGGVSVVLWPRREVDLTCCDCVVSGFCEMMWLLFAVLLVFARHADCGALRCPEGSSCTAEGESKAMVPRECQPGSEWESNCHYCRCSNDGVAECLKQDSCDEIFGEPIRCKPQTSYKSDCNTCRCLENGLSICTLKGCSAFGELNRVKKEVELPSGVDCAPGTSWKNQCNSCHCSSSGYALCTLMECYPYNSEPEVRCAPNTAWKNKCNGCHCSSNGEPSCTRMECVEYLASNTADLDQLQNDEVPRSGTQASLSRKIRAFQEGPKQCQPGQEFRLDCNKCLCDNEGQNFSCTRMDCNAVNHQRETREAFPIARPKRETEKEQVQCVPGSVFDRGCNVCRCSEEGHHAICSMKICRQDNQSKEHAPAEQDLGFRCNPGEQFAHECNDCTCSADGRSVFCTLRLCDKDISADI